MKKNVKIYLFKRYKKIAWDDESPSDQPTTLDFWPNLMLCVESYYKTHSGMTRCHRTARQPIELRYTEKFMKTLNKYCTTKTLKLKLIDILTKTVYKIPCSSLRDAQIKERTNIRHFYVSRFWRVFYRKKSDYILLEEFCPHKKPLYFRRY